MLNILVIHGYVQSAATVAQNTRRLRDALDGVAVLHYVDGPPMGANASSSFSSSSRPWWFLGQSLEFDASRGNSRWDDVVKWWETELSGRQYDGVIGLSQGSAMAALLLSMINHPRRVPGFSPTKKQDFKFGIFCSGFVSHTSPHAEIYGIPDIPTLHTVDDQDTIVRAARTIELQEKCTNSVLYRHHEGHAVPVGGNFPSVLRDFILDATK
ncbi:FSH1 domain-containing protein [Mycena venus]|uniref:FSH1 domain-containing protein n=1 Tax=Mycena venus TaxID=2733690 RepID=A0A8H6Y2C8_9AGAR|nr:FSH1 domain-containing protein [Mycena venus]